MIQPVSQGRDGHLQAVERCVELGESVRVPFLNPLTIEHVFGP